MRPDIYQLTEDQFNVLIGLSESPEKVIILPELLENDTPAFTDKIRRQGEEMHDLIVLGLVEDLTPTIMDAIVAQRVANGRGYEAFKASEIGSTMFRNHKKKFKIN